MKQIPLRDDPSRPPYTGPSHLERALAAVTYTPVVQIGVSDSEMVAAFQESIRHKYPFFETGTDSFINVAVQEDGKASTTRDEIRKWLFRDIERHWTVTLTQDALALESDKAGYQTWPAFMERMTWLVERLQETARPTHVLRLGVRYLNTAPIVEGNDPRAQCAEQLVSITGDSNLELADLLWVFAVAEGGLRLRSGVMSPQSSYDPDFFALRDQPSWYLDIDVVSNHMAKFDAIAISDQLFKQASRVHAIYYWAMKAEDEE